jgi:hypothetical protein
MRLNGKWTFKLVNSGDVFTQVAIGKNMMYALTHQNNLHTSANNGMTWGPWYFGINNPYNLYVSEYTDKWVVDLSADDGKTINTTDVSTMGIKFVHSSTQLVAMDPYLNNLYYVNKV